MFADVRANVLLSWFNVVLDKLVIVLLLYFFVVTDARASMRREIVVLGHFEPVTYLCGFYSYLIIPYCSLPSLWAIHADCVIR